MNEERKYISVEEYARFIGRTSQNVYHMLHKGVLQGMEFKRGSMRGWLIPAPKGYEQINN